MRRDDRNRVAHTRRDHSMSYRVAVATGGAKANEDSTSQRPDPRTQVTQAHGCNPVRGQKRTKQMRRELSRICWRNRVSSVRAQSAKSVTRQNIGDHRGSVEHIAPVSGVTKSMRKHVSRVRGKKSECVTQYTNH